MIAAGCLLPILLMILGGLLGALLGGGAAGLIWWGGSGGFVLGCAGMMGMLWGFERITRR